MVIFRILFIFFNLSNKSKLILIAKTGTGRTDQQELGTGKVYNDNKYKFILEVPFSWNWQGMFVQNAGEKCSMVL